MSRYAVHVFHHGPYVDATWTRTFWFRWRARAYRDALHAHAVGNVSTALYPTPRNRK